MRDLHIGSSIVLLITLIISVKSRTLDVLPLNFLIELTHDRTDLVDDKLRFHAHTGRSCMKRIRKQFRILHLTRKMRYLRQILVDMHSYQNPIERVILDERLDFVEKRFHEFTYKVNPHHIQPGLVLDIDVTTTKRKQYILRGMAGVLNEFLFDISKGFADAAFASFSRRRSTVRDDIDQSFSVEEIQENIFESAYKSVGAADEVKGTVDLTPSTKKSGRGKTSGLKEL